MTQSQDNLLLVVWLMLTALGLVFLALVLVWAIRRGQFRDQDRARYLPLDGGKPPEGDNPSPAAPPTPGEAKDNPGKEGTTNVLL